MPFSIHFAGSIRTAASAWKWGYALALGKWVIGYVASGENLAERVARLQNQPLAEQGRQLRDADGFDVEDFGFTLNLMLAVPVRIVVGGARAVLCACRHLRNKTMTNFKTLALTTLLIAIGWALLPFALGIAWSIVLASVVWPVARKVSHHHRGTMAAGLTLGVLTLMVVPLVMLVIEAAHAWHLLLPWYQQEAANGCPAAPDVVAGNTQALAVWQKASGVLPAALGSHAQDWAQRALGRNEEMLINGLVC